MWPHRLPAVPAVQDTGAALFRPALSPVAGVRLRRARLSTAQASVFPGIVSEVRSSLAKERRVEAAQLEMMHLSK